MKKLLFINSSTNNNKSRTYALSKFFISKLIDKFEVKEIDLYDLDISPINDEFVKNRTSLQSKGDFSSSIFDLAKEFAQADLVVFSAPLWDLSFPSILKVYFEQISVCGITFDITGTGYKGLCKANRAVYISTAGGIYEENLGATYVKALMQMFGINEFTEVTALGIDIYNADLEKILESSRQKLELISKELLKTKKSV